MKISIVIPAYNEVRFIDKTLLSLVSQTLKPHELLVVDDNSTDGTAAIIQEYSSNYSFVNYHKRNSSAEHLPGSKVVQAFDAGLAVLKPDYDVICKFDADLIFPPDYLERLAALFTINPDVGMAGGFCYIEKNGQWVLENLTNKDHIRGALKAYKTGCFTAINGLKPAMGWDSLDELLAQYHGWKVLTDENLKVKHLKPTGHTYTEKAKWKQGEAFYRMRYGVTLTLIASAKLALRKKNLSAFIDYTKGFYLAKKNKKPFLVTAEEGLFIRQLRWKKMKEKFL